MAKKSDKQPEKTAEQIEESAKTFKLPYGPYQGRPVSTVPRTYLRSLLDDKECAEDLKQHYRSLLRTIKEWLRLKKGQPEEEGEPKRQVDGPKRVSHNEVKVSAEEEIPGMRVVE